jgi:general secretion pathway protein A
MYTAYWHIRESPFQNVVNDRLIYMTEQHQEGIARLYYLNDQKRTAGMLTGAYGVGKTMTMEFLNRRAAHHKIPVIKVDAIPDGTLPMARHILRCMNLPDNAPTLPEALMSLQSYCQRTPKNLEHSLLLIDEAHHLAVGDGFYLAHYLCNLRIPGTSDQPERTLFTIILAGTDELRTSLMAQESLRRRIQLDWRLTPLSLQQTTEYVQHHMRSVGGDIWSFAKEALDALYFYTRGVPRSINNICDTALMLGFASQAPHVTKEIIVQAAKDTGLEGYAFQDANGALPGTPAPNPN